MVTVSICQEMGWTYEEYMSQPKWFLNSLMDKMEVDAQEAKKASKRK